VKRKQQVKQRAMAGVIGKALTRRSRGICELCESRDGVRVHELPPFPPDPDPDRSLMACERCRRWLERGGVTPVEAYFLEVAVWSETAPVRLAAGRLLMAVDGAEQPWAREAFDVVDVDPETAEFRLS